MPDHIYINTGADIFQLKPLLEENDYEGGPLSWQEASTFMVHFSSVALQYFIEQHGPIKATKGECLSELVNGLYQLMGDLINLGRFPKEIIGPVFNAYPDQYRKDEPHRVMLKVEFGFKAFGKAVSSKQRGYTLSNVISPKEKLNA